MAKNNKISRISDTGKRDVKLAMGENGMISQMEADDVESLTWKTTGNLGMLKNDC